MTALFLFAVLLDARAQPSSPAAAAAKLPPPPPAVAAMATNDPVGLMHLSENIRGQCISDRRQICGRIIQMLPEGVVVESGYTNLLREPLTGSWLVPGSAEIDRTAKLLESTEPGAVCVGRIFLTDLPRSRGAKPARYDYVIIEAYPAGEYTYTSIGTVQHTVRKFSANLNRAVDYNVNVAVTKMNASAPAPAK